VSLVPRDRMIGCLGLLFILALVSWPIEQLQHLFGWSDLETGGVDLIWFGLLLVGVALRPRRPGRRASQAAAGRGRVADEPRRAEVGGVGRAADIADARTRNPNNWRAASWPAAGRDHPPGLRSPNGMPDVESGPPHRSAGSAPQGVVRARSSIPAQLRFNILQRDGFRCRYCGRTGREPGVVLHVDHVVPVASGGLTTEDNLMTACAACNLGKSAHSVVSV
jgi:HNH endonuclease